MAEKDSVTLERLAQEARLHKVTVSRILNGCYAGKEATKKKVLRLAKKLHYTPNIFARAINRKSLPLAAVLAGHDPFCTPYLRALNIIFDQRQLSMLTSFRASGFQALARQFRPLGLIVFGPNVDPRLKGLWRQPDLVAINCAFEGKKDAACFQVRNDFEAGYQALGRHLIELGHRRFIYVHGAEKRSQHYAPLRQRGLREALSAIGDPDELVQSFALDPGDPRPLAERLKAPGAPTAVVCDNDLLALACHLGLSRLGLRIPRDVSITGCDGIFGAKKLPHLTTLRVRHHKIAWTVAEWITREIGPAKQRGEAARPQMKVFPCDLAPGASSGPAPKR